MFYRYLTAMIFAMMLLSACSTLGNMGIPFFDEDNNDLNTISIKSSADCNRNNPVALDVVFIYDDEVKSLLKNLSGPTWFKQKKELMLKYERNMEIVGIEVVPLTASIPLTLPEDSNDAVEILLFANYVARAGQYVAGLSAFIELEIELDRDLYHLREVSK